MLTRHIPALARPCSRRPPIAWKSAARTPHARGQKVGNIGLTGARQEKAWYALKSTGMCLPKWVLGCEAEAVSGEHPAGSAGT